MPRIDPLQLLKCLSVLLAPHGGIKSPEDVARLVSLMSKFSKKLVSKCIYVQILQATSSQLLELFMRDGGWDLVSQWIIEAANLSNGPLLEQLLELTLHSPLDLAQLQINNCPRTVKALTREAPTQRVRELACMVVDAWVQMAREGLNPPQVPEVPMVKPEVLPVVKPETSTVQFESLECVPEQYIVPVAPMPVIAAVPQVIPEVPTVCDVLPEMAESMHVEEPCVQEVVSDQVDNAMEVPMEELEEEDEETSTEENEGWDAPLGQLPVYKITIKNGKQVLAKVYSGDRQKQNVTSGNVVLNVAQEMVRPPPVEKVVEVVPEVKTGPVRKEVPRGASRRKQQLKPSCTDAEAPLEMSETERKKVATAEKISARMAKEQAARRQERLLREKQAKLREKLAEREAKEKERRAKVQEEKDQATLARLMGTNRLSLGKIPKKSRPENEKKLTPEDIKSELRRSSSEDERRKSKSKSDSSKSDGKSPSNKNDHKTSKNSSKSSIGLSNGTSSNSSSSSSSSSKSKVKTFSSKPRSTGLEEAIPPPSRKKDKDKEKRPVLPIKRSPTPLGKDQTPPEKKPKAEEEVKKPALSKPKPKQAVIQESDFFMDALTAVARPEPRKRKRRISSSKDDKAESGKDESPGVKSEPGQVKDTPESPSQSPRDNKSPSARPSFQFYTDTLETKTEPDVVESEEPMRECSDRTPTPPPVEGEEEPRRSCDEGLTRGVLVLHRSINRVKKSVRFRADDELVSTLYFELDETERVNVTKTFGDMRMQDLEHERELMQNARKTANNDTQEEKTPWRPLIPIDCTANLVEPGKNSREKGIQFAREKTVLQALYFNSTMVPDYPAEPDQESHPTTDPVIIPQEDMTGNPDSVKDFTHVPWPEPKTGLGPTFATFSPTTPPQSVGGMGGGWRTGDGQVLASGPGEVFPPANNFTPPPHAGYETGNPPSYNYGYETPNQFGDNPNFVPPPDVNNFSPDMSNGPPNNFMFPPPGNFRPPGNWGPPPMGGPPMGPGPMGPGPMGPGPMGPGPGPGPMGPNNNDMRAGPRFRGNMGPRRGNWQGGPPRGSGGSRGKGWGGGAPRSVCKHFRSGYCRNEERCQFLHPGVNGPKF